MRSSNLVIGKWWQCIAFLTGNGKKEKKVGWSNHKNVNGGVGGWDQVLVFTGGLKQIKAPGKFRARLHTISKDSSQTLNIQ